MCTKKGNSMLGKEVMITKSLANTALARYSIEATASISLQNIRLSFIETSSKIDCKKRGRLTTSTTFAANVYIKSFRGASRFDYRLSKSLKFDLSGYSDGKQQFSCKEVGDDRRKGFVEKCFFLKIIHLYKLVI
jgi:hypothetical protein